MALRKARDGDGSSVCRGYVASRKATRKPVQARNDLRRHKPLPPLEPPPAMRFMALPSILFDQCPCIRGFGRYLGRVFIGTNG